MLLILALLALIGAALLAWRHTMHARETAIAACRRACAEAEVQLLDDTVALRRLRPCRSRRGALALERVYLFEFSRDGRLRERGSVVLRGLRVSHVYLTPDLRLFDDAQRRSP